MVIHVPAGFKGASRKCLLVDDDPDFLTYVLSATEPYNLTFDTCRTLSEAQQKIHSCAYDAYIVNLSLPDGFGLELVQEIRSREEGGQNPIAVITGPFGDEQMVALLKDKYAVEAIFNKPISPQQLDALLIKLCRLPLVEHVGQGADAVGGPIHEPASIPRPSVYIVDGDVKFLELLQREQEGFAIDLFVEANPEHALALLKSPEFNPRIIVSSQTFLGSSLSAFDLFDSVRKKPGAISTIFCISLDKDSLEIRMEAIKQGVVYIFNKPISAHAMLTTMSEALEMGSLRNFKVLILEDDRDVCHFIASALAEVGIEARSLADPLSLYPMLEEYVPDLLFLDIDLPAYGGFNLLKTLRMDAVYKNLIIVVLTARKWSYEAEVDAELSSYGGNADGILYKPLNKKIVQEFVLNVSKRTILLKLSTVQSRVGLKTLKILLSDLREELMAPPFAAHLVLIRMDHAADLVLQYGQGGVNEFTILVSNVLQRMEDSATTCYFFASTFAIFFRGSNRNTIEKKLFDVLTSILSQSSLNISFSCGIVPISAEFKNGHEIIRAAENALQEAGRQEPAPVKIGSYMPTEAAPSIKKSLMLIEPNEDLSLILKTAFDAHDLTVQTFSEGKPALQALLNCHEAQLPALVIAERKLPDMDGIEILKGLNARFKSPVPFYFLTDFVAEKDVSEGIKYGALEYIAKPFNLALLIQKSIKTIFERKP